MWGHVKIGPLRELDLGHAKNKIGQHSKFVKKKNWGMRN
jgi:hypothetical protein